ncbi:hypothetical protein K501DRAFT_334568 [Backusella circina FSU 941]|nr:hypothetical protein K501DRAFT_334568 [Backusella circina FSU 941]
MTVDITKTKDEEIQESQSRGKVDIPYDQITKKVFLDANKIFPNNTSFQQYQQQGVEHFSLFADINRANNFIQNYLDLETLKPISKKSTMSLTALEERRQRRLSRNRIAAKECRRKKKKYVGEMEEKIKLLEQENERLKKELQDLQNKLMHGSENYQLMKQVQELNAKLDITRS